MLLSSLCRAVRDVADPEPGLEAAMLIEAMHARVFSAALQQDVVTVIGPGCCQRGVNDGASMALTAKFGMRDHVLEKAVPPSGTQQIWRGDQHAGCNDLRVDCGYEYRNAVVGQHFRPNSLGSLDRFRTGAYFRDAIELEQRGKVGCLGKSGVGHLNTEL
jgi:hypothetical protein